MTHFTMAFPMLLAMGLAGALHCAGMCGGLAILATSSHGITRLLLYLLGKASSYLILGALAGAAGEAVVRAAPLGTGSRGLAIAGAVLLAAAGLESLGLLRIPAPGVQRLSKAIAGIVRMAAGTASGTLLVGAANGLLPCPMVYGFLAVAASTGSAVWGTATMAVLGVTSAVPLALCSLIGHSFTVSKTIRMDRIAGILMLLMAALTLYRGTLALTLAHHMH